MDHFLVVAKIKLKLQRQKWLDSKNNVPYNLKLLKDDKIQQDYTKRVNKFFENIEEKEIEGK